MQAFVASKGVGFIADDAVGHLCSIFQEEDNIFLSEEPSSGPPVIAKKAVFVEGVEVCKTEDPVEQLLAWGASFSVYTQRPTFRKYENVACIMTHFVVKTDEGKMPRKLEKVWKATLAP